ncbi:EthD family reductase [Chitinophaga horti]|uniref:EthD family reductase n=1 Tax=Chitinophaga horti TaxID=2920382 RepID=A0ABY6J7J1_9BACT|nr:EthD family reductase [Chitinophaga horti]UYQ95660.1 EthD family reductase [Chitinophaga horti]
MKRKLFLTLLLVTTFFAAFSQDKPAAEKGLIKISVMYPFSEGKTFNMEYYEAKHMPMVAKFLGTNLVKYTIEKGLSSGMPNQPLPYMAIGTFYVKSLSEYQAAISPNRDAIRADFANYTNVAPVILVSEVVK